MAAAEVTADELTRGLDVYSAHAPLLQKVLDPATYPLAARVGTAAGTAHRAAYDPQNAYDFGLQTILGGLAALISNAS